MYGQNIIYLSFKVTPNIGIQHILSLLLENAKFVMIWVNIHKMLRLELKLKTRVQSPIYTQSMISINLSFVLSGKNLCVFKVIFNWI